MAYDVNTDYTAKNAELQKALAAATDSATKAAIQAQIDANDTSRTEKMASDLTTYGKYATDSELNNAAGIMAQNQIGTTYETQARNINTNYDKYKQNANNDALSRGMARSSFVSDRMANLDSQRGTALTDNDAAKALAIRSAQTNIIDNYRTNAKNDVAIAKNDLANEKAEYADNKMTYYQDYQAEINNVLGDNDPSNDWKADKLQGWRNEKLLAQEAAALKAAKTYSGGTYSGGGGVGVIDDNGGPWGDKEITSTSQLSGAAYNIIKPSTLRNSDASMVASQIESALSNGKITKSEADYMLSYIGY